MFKRYYEYDTEIYFYLKTEDVPEFSLLSDYYSLKLSGILEYISYFDDIYAVYEFIKSNEAINRFKLLKSITIGNNKSVIGSDCVISIVHFYKLKRLKHIYNKEKNKIEVIE